MSIFTNALQWFRRNEPAAEPRRTRVVRQQQAYQRSFAGARQDRLTADFAMFDSGPNAELEADLPNLRRRSHQNANDQDHAKRFVELCKTNIVGPDGILIDPQPKTRRGALDKNAQEKIRNAYKEWTKKANYTVTGQLSKASSERLAIESIVKDGEGLARFVYGADSGNKQGFAIQHLEAHLLDDQYSIRASRDRRSIIMGVEVTSKNRPTGYWLLREHPGEIPTQGPLRMRVPADRMIHAYLARRPGAVRGVPWMHSSTRRLRQLGGYEEAELVAARHAAEKFGVMVSPDGMPLEGDDEDTDGAALMESQAGTWEMMPEGYDFRQFDPQHPTAAFDAFVKANLRSLAAGLGVSYHSLSMDLSGANYSSLRQGHNEDRDVWRTLQNWFIEHWVQPVYEAWLARMLLMNRIDLPDEPERFLHANYRPRGWRHVDPDKGSKAFETELRLGVNTRTQYVRETQQRDLADVLAERVAEEEMAADMGLDLTLTAPEPAQAEPEPTNEGADNAANEQANV